MRRASSPDPASRGGWRALARGAGRFVAAPASAILSHLSALGAGFVWLDHAHIETGYGVEPKARWLEAFTGGFAGTGFYRPLMTLSLSLDAALGGQAWIYHATSIAWHAAAALAVVAAGEALGLSWRAATIAGVLFAVHPLSSLVADAIAFRSEAMVVFLLLGLVWAHVRGRPLLASAALFAGALTKETALVLGPLFVVAIELGRAIEPGRARAPKPKARRRAAALATRKRLFAAEGAALVGALVLRLAFAPAWRASHESLGLGDAIGTRLAALAKSARSVVLPIDRTICDAFPVTSPWAATALAGLLIAFLVGFIAWRRRGPAVLLALALLPSLQLVPVMRWWSPHYVYLPLAFIAMLVAEGIDRAGGRAVVAAGCASFLFGVVALRDGFRFRTDETLWTPEVDMEPSCREGQFYLGELDRQNRRWDAAASRYEQALAPRSGVLAYVDRLAALQNLGTVRLEQDRFAEAATAFRTALDATTDPLGRRKLVHNVASAVLRAGDAAEAARLLEPETSRDDAFPESLLLHAKALHELGRNDESRVLLMRLRRGRPTDR